MKNEILESISFKEYHKIKEFICSLIAVIVILLSLFFCFLDNTNRLELSIITFLKNIAYYFCNVFAPGVKIDAGVHLDKVIEMKGGIDNYSILPVDFEIFKAEIQTYFGMLFDLKNYQEFFLEKSYLLLVFFRFLMIILPLIFFVKMLVDNYLSEDLQRKKEKSKPYQFYLQFEKKILYRFLNFLKELMDYFLHSKFYILLFSIILAFDMNLFSVILDLIVWLFYFSSSLNLLSIFEIIVVVMLDLGPFLLKIPFVIYLLIVYIIYDKIRKKKAYEDLQHFENYNKGFITSLGLNTLIIGAPGAGKTQLMTDMVLSSEEILRTRLLNILLEIKLEFPNFPFDQLEKEIDRLVKEHRIFNVFQAKDFIDYKFTLNEFYHYDFHHFNILYDNGLYFENIYEGLCDYAKAYYLYSLKTPLSATNYAIRHDGKLIDKGHFKIWKYDFFRSKSGEIDYHFTSKILDFNAMRIQKKLNSEVKNAYKLDGNVVAITEFGKERRNQFYTNKLDKSDLKANQLNDGFNDYLKMKRHDCTIRNKPIFMLFADDQREEAVNADARDLFEYKITIHQQDSFFKSSLLNFDISLITLFFEWIVQKVSDFNLRYDVVRSDKTLFKYLINKIAYRSNQYLVKRHNIFDYKVMELNISNGIDNYKQKYFLMKKKIYSRRYSTDCYSSFFEEKYLNASEGFIDLNNFDYYIPSIKELTSMNSYFINDLNKIFEESNAFSWINEKVNY